MEVGSSSLPGTTRRRSGNVCTKVQALGDRLSGFHGGLAQLARAPALQAGGQRFESVILHSWDAAADTFRAGRFPQDLGHVDTSKTVSKTYEKLNRTIKLQLKV